MQFNLSAEDAKVVQQAVQILQKSLVSRGDCFANPTETRRYLQFKLANLDYEVFGVLFTDNRHRLIEDKIMFRGTIDGANVYPREVAKESLSLNAAAVILYHNHPSGMCEPSGADRAITKRLIDALGLLDIRVLDHILVAANTTLSFAEHGLI